MQRKDIARGKAYVYHEGRELRYVSAANLAPVVVLSTEVHIIDAHRPLMPAPGTKMGRKWSRLAGLPAVRLATPEDAGRVPELAAIPDFRPGKEVFDGDRRIGTCIMITSSIYLHGEYAEVRARKEAAEKERGAAAKVRSQQNADRLLAFRDLQRRLIALGLNHLQHSSDINVPSKVELTFEQAEWLISVAEQMKETKNREESR